MGGSEGGGVARRPAQAFEQGLGEEGLEQDIEVFDAVLGFRRAGGEDDEPRRRFLLGEGVQCGEAVGVGQVEVDERDGAAAARFEPRDDVGGVLDELGPAAQRAIQSCRRAPRRGLSSTMRMSRPSTWMCFWVQTGGLEPSTG